MPKQWRRAGWTIFAKSFRCMDADGSRLSRRGRGAAFGRNQRKSISRRGRRERREENKSNSFTQRPLRSLRENILSARRDSGRLQCGAKKHQDETTRPQSQMHVSVHVAFRCPSISTVTAARS
jgi:hypothetical protein